MRLINYFKKGEVVYHLNSKNLKMIIEHIDQDTDEILCGWLDQKGDVVSFKFKSKEIGKVSDLNRVRKNNIRKIAI